MRVKVITREGIWQKVRINPKNYNKLKKKHGKDGIKIISEGKYVTHQI